MVQEEAGWGGGRSGLHNCGFSCCRTVVLGLMGVVGYAVQRELTRPKPGVRAATTATGPAVRALTGEEEGYAAMLWPIHSEIKLAAVEMSFAGIAYKMGDEDADRLAARLAPLVESLDAAMQRARALQVPGSMAGLHERYVAALGLYEQAAAEMISATRDGKDEHLVAGQRMSLHATEEMLRVGNVLWPGEYKPH